MKTLKKLLLITCLSAGTIGLSEAATPHPPDLVKDGNRWTITAYDDASTVHNQWATQGICFYYAGTNGTQQLYRWVSDTFPDWNGRATQEGDQIFMYGDYAKDVGHDGMDWEITTNSPKSEGFGHWKEWREDGKLGRTIGFLNAKFQRVGKCAMFKADIAEQSYKYIELPRNKRGEPIATPTGLTERQLKLPQEK